LPVSEDRFSEKNRLKRYDCAESFTLTAPVGSKPVLVIMSDRIRALLLSFTKVACGVLAFVLFMWTPKTGKGILLYAAAFVVLIIFGVALSRGSSGKFRRW
jgi:hypothetical protein